MGKLLQFDRRGRRTAHYRPFQPGDGQVLIFTGIRYERAAPPASGNNAPTPVKPRRKRG